MANLGRLPSGGGPHSATRLQPVSAGTGQRNSCWPMTQSDYLHLASASAAACSVAPTTEGELGAFSMVPPKAIVLYDFKAQSEREVAVLAGDMVDCIAIDSDRKWLYVRTLRNTTGYVPTSYCRFMAVANAHTPSLPPPPPLAPTPAPVPLEPPVQTQTQTQAQIRPSLAPADQPLPLMTADQLHHSLDRRMLKRLHYYYQNHYQNQNPNPNQYQNQCQYPMFASATAARPTAVTCASNDAQVAPISHIAESSVDRFSCADRAATTLSPCSIVSTSSGVSTGGTDSSHIDSKSEQSEDVVPFNRAAVAQYGSASGSSTCSSACERRIKMLKTNEQKKLLRAKSAESVGAATDASQPQRPADASASEKLVDVLWGQTLRRQVATAAASVGVRRPVAVKALHAMSASKTTEGNVQAQPLDSEASACNVCANKTDAIVCETFV